MKDSFVTYKEIQKVLTGSSTKIRSDLDEIYRHLDSITIPEMIGEWRGQCIKTGSKFDLILHKFRYISWHGKVFYDENRVNALIMNLVGNRFPIPYFGSAIIRELKFREKVSVSMIYNYLPIIDHFRKINPSTLMGIMTLKGNVEVYFLLHR